MTSKFGDRPVPLMFLPHFDAIFSDLWVNEHIAFYFFASYNEQKSRTRFVAVGRRMFWSRQEQMSRRPLTSAYILGTERECWFSQRPFDTHYFYWQLSKLVLAPPPLPPPPLRGVMQTSCKLFATFEKAENTIFLWSYSCVFTLTDHE